MNYAGNGEKIIRLPFVERVSLTEIRIFEKDGKIMVNYQRSWWTRNDANEQLHYKIESALRLQNLVNDRIKQYDEERKQAWYPSKKRGMLYKKKKYLQTLVDQSSTTVGVNGK